MTLNAIHEVVEDEWLSEKFRLEIAKKAIGRNKQILQTEKRRNEERMVVAKITALVGGGYRKKNVEKLKGNKIQFTSSENVLLHICKQLNFVQIGVQSRGWVERCLAQEFWISNFWWLSWKSVHLC